jgi:hypothetical protein
VQVRVGLLRHFFVPTYIFDEGPHFVSGHDLCLYITWNAAILCITCGRGIGQRLQWRVLSQWTSDDGRCGQPSTVDCEILNAPNVHKMFNTTKTYDDKFTNCSMKNRKPVTTRS